VYASLCYRSIFGEGGDGGGGGEKYEKHSETSSCVIYRPGFYVYVNNDSAFLPAPMSIIAPSSPLSLSRANEYPLRPTPLLKDPS